jgi:DNA-binding MarR family transcriptional regulator
MSYKIELVKQLLQYIDTYNNENNKADIKEFSLFLKEKVFNESSKVPSSENNRLDYLNYKSYKDVEFSTLLTGLFRFAKHYLKKTFKKSSFKTIDEFGFLASLLKDGSFFKNELINSHHMEVSSGSEIIKRLLRSGLIHEFPDENDKRAVRIEITEKGKKELIQAFDEMYIVSKIIKGKITEKELNDTLIVLNKLTYFHNTIWENDKNTPLEELYEKYMTNEFLN